MNDFRFRQIHLDFHTSELIENIGEKFDKKDFQNKLKLGHVNSINVFAKCHHGWAYHPTTANEMHPNLSFDLLGEIIDACHEIDVTAPIYISAGLDEKMARRHPEWLVRNKDESLSCFGVLSNNFMEPGYHEFCFNTPYLDYLLKQIEEILLNYTCDGIWLDIVGERKCYCQNCIKTLLAEGKDPTNEEEIIKLSKKTYANYVKRVKDLVERLKPGTPIFHNSGHIHRGRIDLLHASTHAEIESLPTGGWGYENYPITARYIQNKVDFFLGMTGKFHTTWGEFGGFKHPNALLYETSSCIAHGGGCSIGDQMHPCGNLDEATYEMIGKAYKEVEEKEEWCTNVTSFADVAFVTLEAARIGGCIAKESQHIFDDTISKSDVGTLRILQEGHFLYDVIDLDDDFESYKVIILPDYIRITECLKNKIDKYLENGGKILATGESCLDLNKSKFMIDFGAKYIGENSYSPSYISPNFDLDSLKRSVFVQYANGQDIENIDADVKAYSIDPYFNRQTFSFSSHQHTPYKLHGDKPGIVENKNGIYIAWNMFEEYGKVGSFVTKEIIIHCLNLLLKEKTVEVDLPSQGTVTLMHQKDKKRIIQHLLYASPIKRGDIKVGTDPRDSISLEVIEDIITIKEVKTRIRLNYTVKNVYLAPQMEKVAYEYSDGLLYYSVNNVKVHQMVVIEYE